MFDSMKLPDLSTLTETEISTFVLSCEEKQKMTLSKIAATILKSGVRLVALAGPSCSGKTTTAHRLIRFLEQSGKSVKVLSTDDFFLDVDTYPQTADGVPDFDHFNRLDSVYLSEALRTLLAGKTVRLPSFDFLTGARKSEYETYTPTADTVVVLEGIHALNDALYEPNARFYRLALNVTEPVIWEGNPLFDAREVRLLRRIIRDEKFRAYNADQTLRIWQNVVRGEVNFIFPFLKNADALLPTGLLYEAYIWRNDALDSVSAVPPESPSYAAAQSLKARLELLPSLPASLIPEDSILHEFLG